MKMTKLLPLKSVPIHIKVYGYIFRGSNCHLHICFPSKQGFALKERNLLQDEQILSLKS